jgi:hypothetical protein
VVREQESSHFWGAKAAGGTPPTSGFFNIVHENPFFLIK